MSQALGLGSEGPGEMRTSCYWGQERGGLAQALSKHLGRAAAALEEADTESVGDRCPQISSSTIPLAATPAVSRAGSTGGSVLGGLVSKHGPSGARQKGGGGKGLHRTEFYQGPPRTPGPQRARASGFFPACQAISFFMKASS